MLQVLESNKLSEPSVNRRRHRRDADLALRLGHEIRNIRKRHGLTVVELTKLAGLSSGSLSKIENGITSPSLNTLQRLATALNASVTALFGRFEERSDATYVPAGEGLKIQRRGPHAGHEYQLLGHSVGKRAPVEPFIITLSDKSDLFQSYRHPGTELLYVLEGRMDYHHGGETHSMGPGDSLCFNAGTAHGPVDLIETPVRLVCVIAKTG